MVKKNCLSLCLITKNDAGYLTNCLRNMQEVADEIIIVDRGSVDSTIELARQLGACVYQTPWENDDSRLKNFCLARAWGRWVLFLQANEVINPQQLKELPGLLKNPNVEGYLLYIDHSQNYRIASPVQSLRLIRNREEYRYKYRVLTRIPDELLSNIKDSGIRIIQHTAPDGVGDNNQLQLILKEELREYPDDSYLQYMYGIELLNQQRFPESIEYFQKARHTVNHAYLFAPHLDKCLSWALISRERFADALDVLDEGIKNFPFYTDLLVLRGELRKRFQQYGEAIRDLEKSLQIRAKPNFRVPEPEINTSIILEILGDIHAEAFNYRQALISYHQSFELNKNNAQILYKIGGLGKKADCAPLLSNLLQEAWEEKNLRRLMVIMDVLYQQREYQEVLAHVENLESLLGTGEQTASIKASCYLMLGEPEKAELFFSALPKESPLFNHLLLQRLESSWVYGQWHKAGKLLQEMDKASGIEKSIGDLYHLLQNLLTEQELRYISLSDHHYEIVQALLEKFLWLRKVEAAQLLLPLLLQSGDEGKLINLAVLWTEADDYQTLEKIFGQISDKQKQLEFKEKVIEQLLWKEEIDMAQKVLGLGDKQPLGPLEYVVWAQGFRKRLRGWLLESKQPSQAQVRPGQALAAFYQCLVLPKNLKHERCPETLTSSQIHGEIGDFYRKAKKKQEALAAYFRALHWEPLDNPVQGKILEIFHENPLQFYEFLAGKSWFLEGAWFRHKQEFINYIRGLIDFRNREFAKASVSFGKIGEDETSYPLARAYIISSNWLLGKEAEAERLLKEEKGFAEIRSLFFTICKSYALARLQEGQQQFSYSELIRVETEKIRMG
ncbi:MAG: glycosyltransferase [Peptococcaceae bacterium]